MKRHLMVAAGLMMFASVAGAQNECPAGQSTITGPDQKRASQDACQMAVDVFGFVAPQLGLALAGGNPTIGLGSTLGGLGHFSVGVRGNVFSGDLPQITQFTPGSNGRGNPAVLPSKSQVIGLPTVDAAIGLFSGIPLGLTNVGGVDLLVSATYLPTIGDQTSDVQIKPDQSFKFGFGARLGILQESIVVPGVSLTYLKRDLPTTSILGKSSSIDVAITNASVKTNAWRLMASKSFLIFGLVAGVGQDKYDQSANVQATFRGTVLGGPPEAKSDVISLAQSITRTNVFLDASLNLPLFKLVGEVGQASGGSVSGLYDSFSGGTASKSRTYGSFGIRFGI
ncbi:MAG: hypothetical protein H0W68_04525 [Gemmatimonadaceae bacterium]|nr:hypothetical protein [Gemmatimonadaceae bacterium]